VDRLSTGVLVDYPYGRAQSVIFLASSPMASQYITQTDLSLYVSLYVSRISLLFLPSSLVNYSDGCSVTRQFATRVIRATIRFRFSYNSWRSCTLKINSGHSNSLDCSHAFPSLLSLFRIAGKATPSQCAQEIVAEKWAGGEERRQQGGDELARRVGPRPTGPLAPRPDPNTSCTILY
jgi:hypothetical protein